MPAASSRSSSTRSRAATRTPNARRTRARPEGRVAQPPVIAPSILPKDVARLGDDVARVLADGADGIHFDVVDHHDVPNLTTGPQVCAAIVPYAHRGDTRAPIDAHRMVEPVDVLVPLFAKAGATGLSFHPEASRHAHRTIALIRDQGCKPGLALNPTTPVEWIDEVLDDLDLVLLMSVNPGFGR